jgi:hypothetical protein
MLPRPTIEAFDAYLSERHLRLEAIIALILKALGRADLLKTKLFALCDRGIDLGDCLALAPAADELDDAEPWLFVQDTNPQWPDHVRATLDDLRRRLGHGL